MQELMVPDNKNLSKIDTLVTEYLHLEINGKLTKALVLGNAIQTLESLLNKEIMAPIMKLKGSKLGFRTDKDNYDHGYSEGIVKRCFIEALLVGVEPVGNQFNIIAENMYITKEGCTHLLSNIKGLTYSVVPCVPNVNKSPEGEYSAIVKVKVCWTYKGNERKQELEFSCKGAADKRGKHITGADAYIGKAERKAKHWLYSHITGQSIGEGEVEDSIDVEFSEVDTKTSEQSPYKKKADVENPPAPVPTEMSDRNVESNFHFLVEKIGKDKVSAYFSQVAKTTIVLVKQDLPRIRKILDDKEAFAEVVNGFWHESQTVD